MTLGTDDLQTAGLSCHIVKLDIGTTACHVGRDGNGICLSCLSYDLSLKLMELGIQYIVGDSLSLQHSAEKLGSLDGDRTNQYRLMFCVSFLNCLYNGVEFLFLCHVNSIVKVFTLYYTVGRDLYNVHAVNITELFFFGEGCTCHTAFFIIFVEKVLEGNGCESLALSLNLHMLFRLDRLMKTIGVTTTRHDTSGKLINDQDLVIFYNIILILVHQIMCTKCKDDVVLDLQVFRICQVLDIKEFLNLLDTLLGKVDDLIFLIYNEVTGLDNLLTHDGCHLGHLMAGLTTLQLLCKDIAHLIKLGGLAALSGNDQRCTCLIDQDRVDLIDDTVVKISLNKLFFIDDHIVTKIIKSKFVVCYVCDVTSVCRTTLFRLHVVKYHAYSQAKELVNLTHPLSISFCQVVVDGYDVDTFSLKGIQICRKCGNKSFTFTCFHLGDTALVKDDTTDDLYTVMLHSKYTFGCLTYGGKCLRKKIIQCCTFCKTFLIFSCLVS